MSNRNVVSMLNRRGQKATLRKPTYGSYNPETGTQQGNSFQNYTVNCYFAEYKSSEVNNDSILMGDRKVLVSPILTNGDTTPEPDTEDIFIGVGDQAIVKDVQRIYNGSTVVAYLCQVRS